MIREACSIVEEEAPSAIAHNRADLHISKANWDRVGAKLRLAPRELEMVQHIFAGKKLAVAAQDMNIALGTVKTYAQRVRSKLGVCNQQELTMVIVCTYFKIVEG